MIEVALRRRATRDSVPGTLGERRCRDAGLCLVVGSVRGPSPGKRGAGLLERMVARKTVCLRRLAGGRRSDIVRFGRFLANGKVTVPRLLAGWGERTAG